MEKLVSELFASKDITKVQSYILQSYTITQLSAQGVVTVLWEYFTLALPTSDPEKSRNAIQVLLVVVLELVLVLLAASGVCVWSIVIGLAAQTVWEMLVKTRRVPGLG